MEIRQKLMLAGGGAVAALALVGGAVMAQTPDSGAPGSSATPGAQATPTTPSTPSAPDTAPAPSTPGRGRDGDCPDKGTDGTTTTTGFRGSRGRGNSQPSSLFGY